MDLNWLKELDAAFTVCDPDGKILYMNNKSVKTFEKDGGEKLIGKNLFECHPGDSGNKLKNLLTNKISNCYTIEKDNVKKLIFQSPWFENSEFQGFVELSITLPDKIPHFIR